MLIKTKQSCLILYLYVTNLGCQWVACVSVSLSGKDFVFRLPQNGAKKSRSIKISCFIDGAFDENLFQNQKTWFGPDRQLLANGNVSYSDSVKVVDLDSNLLMAIDLSDLDEKDAGRYECKLFNASSYATLHIYSSPQVSTEAAAKEAYEGFPTEVARCHANLSYPHAQIWFENKLGDFVETTEEMQFERVGYERVNVTRKFSRVFSSRLDGKESFYCVVSHPTFSRPKRTLLPAFKLKSFDEIIQISGRNGVEVSETILRVGKHEMDVFLNCRGHGPFRGLNVSWFSDEPNETGNGFLHTEQLVSTSAELKIPFSEVFTDGSYRCVIENASKLKAQRRIFVKHQEKDKSPENESTEGKRLRNGSIVLIVCAVLITTFLTFSIIWIFLTKKTRRKRKYLVIKK